MLHIYELINLDETLVEKNLTDLLIKHLISICKAPYNQSMQERLCSPHLHHLTVISNYLL
ncbi:hypothetical protein BK729_09200 [Bacillus thuringiensis serovar wratislaviensis]|nr:hypothetical protein BK729_09200 [Bacillus thuringiensis serovar wratislaviensis]